MYSFTGIINTATQNRVVLAIVVFCLVFKTLLYCVLSPKKSLSAVLRSSHIFLVMKHFPFFFFFYYRYAGAGVFIKQ